MIKEIQYAGYTTEPSDYECADGQLATSLNLVNEDNQLKPVFQPATRITMPTTCEVIFIHKTNSYEHLIVRRTDTGVLYWFDGSITAITDDDVSADSSNMLGNYSVTHVDAVGNTLMGFTSSSIEYFLWKSGNYSYLGNKLPEVAISFGLIGYPVLYSTVIDKGASTQRGTFTVTFDGDGIRKEDIYSDFSDANKAIVTEQVMAKLNKLISEQTIEKGRFCFPFFVRWAYRLYDGSHVMHSAPVLMCPSTTPAPVVFWKRSTGKNHYEEAELDILMIAAELDYCLTNHGDAVDLERWKDIIDGIDIFVSKPIYTYDQNGEITGFNDDNNFDSKFIGRLKTNKRFGDSGWKDKYMEFSYKHIFQYLFIGTDTTGVPNTTVHLPEFSENKLEENIENVANFYKLATLQFSELLQRDVRKVIPVKDDYLQSLVNREVLTDDYLTHDRLAASSSYGFNSRLNLAGVKRGLFSGFISNALFAYCQCDYTFSPTVSPYFTPQDTSSIFTASLRMRVYIRENGQEYYVENVPDEFVPALKVFVPCSSNWTTTETRTDGTSRVIEYNWQAGTKTITEYDSSGSQTSTETLEGRYRPTAFGSWLFYPNANAYKVIIYQNETRIFSCDLKAHDLLNGAYAWLGFASERPNPSLSPIPVPSATPANDILIDASNKIYTSEVNNPFYFPLLGINAVGGGKVMAISSANKALSQGQFGQFPLYAFTDEGVWSLEVSSDGLYSARQPITRDVCINPDSITQLDNSVLFATDRGIMLITGSETACITDGIFDETPFDVTALPGVTQLHTLIGHTADACLPTKPLLAFLSGCQIIYDYVHQRIFVFNPETENGEPIYTYAYVYSLESKKWGMIHSLLTSRLNSYPDALAMAAGETVTGTKINKLVSFSNVGEAECKGLFITRPLKLDASDIQKAVSEIIQRGHFEKGDVTTVLYGSRDLYNWQLIWSSQDHYLRGFRGTSYKYFRIAGTATLTEDESIFGASINYEPRFTNRLR